MSIDEAAGARLRAAGRSLLEAIPVHAGPRLATPSGSVVHSLRPPGTFAFHSQSDCVVVLLAPVQGFEVRSSSGPTRIFDAPAGAVAIVPAGIERSGGWASALESLTVSFESDQLGALAEREFDLPQLTFSQSGFTPVDEQALQIAHLLRSELQSDAPSALYADSLITALGLHVIRRYSSAAGQAKLIRPLGGLSPAAAKRVQEFLNRNVANKVTIAELAAACELSPSHFIEAFATTFGTSPYRYLLDLRLNLAVQLLSQTALPIAEIAYLSGFSSQSHLTSTMRKYRQTTPAQVRSSTK